MAAKNRKVLARRLSRGKLVCMQTYLMMSSARETTRSANPKQCWHFVLTSRRRDAIVVGASLSQDAARREARRIGGVTRTGFIDRSGSVWRAVIPSRTTTPDDLRLALGLPPAT